MHLFLKSARHPAVSSTWEGGNFVAESALRLLPFFLSLPVFFRLIDYSKVSKLLIFLLFFFFAVVLQLGKYSNKAAAGGGVKMYGIPSVPLCDLEVNHFTIFSVSAYIFFTQTGKRMSVLDVSTSWTLLAFFETLFFF